MSDNLPTPIHPGNPLGSPRKPGARNGTHAIDWKSAKMIQAMLCGISEPIEDNVVGTIPANKPLSLEQAARAVNMKLKRARALRMTPEFCEAMRQATAAYRACLEPGNIATALEIRDDKLVKPKDRIKAMQFLQGPQPGRAGVQVTVNNQSGISPGYIIRLDNPPEPIPGTFIHHQAEVVPALPTAQNNAGATARDLDKEPGTMSGRGSAGHDARANSTMRCRKDHRLSRQWRIRAHKAGAPITREETFEAPARLLHAKEDHIYPDENCPEDWNS